MEIQINFNITHYIFARTLAEHFYELKSTEIGKLGKRDAKKIMFTHLEKFGTGSSFEKEKGFNLYWHDNNYRCLLAEATLLVEEYLSK